MTTNWDLFKQAAILQPVDEIPVSFIVDSPWLIAYSGLTAMEYYLEPDRWFKVHMDLMNRLPDAVLIPGFWVEYGMAVEPSAFGARMHFHPDRPPSMEPVVMDIEHWAEADMPDAREDGLMPFVYHQYKRAEEKLNAEGLGIKMVCARGPMVTAGWITGITDLMLGLVEKPKATAKVLDKVTTTLITYLHTQLDCLKEPEAIMLLDDIVGMVSEDLYHEFIEPHLRRIFDEFDGLVKVYHNDTPCKHLFPSLAEANFDVFNFTYEVDIAEAKSIMGHRVAMLGSVPPLQIVVRETPEVVAKWTQNVLDRGAPGGGLILSVGGGISPGTPIENLDAMIKTAKAWRPHNRPIEDFPQLKLYEDDRPKTKRRPRRNYRA